MREVFSFEGNSELERFYAELGSNIAKFCEQDKPLDSSTVMEMMLYCLKRVFEEPNNE